MATESPAILYEHADGRRAVVSANRVATFAIDNPDWHRAGPVEIVWVDETAPAWRPIETAPKDGTTVLVYPSTWDDRTCSTASWESDRYAKKPRPYWRRDDDLGRVAHSREALTTHWMPMPLPPSPSSADEGGSKT